METQIFVLCEETVVRYHFSHCVPSMRTWLCNNIACSPHNWISLQSLFQHLGGCLLTPLPVFFQLTCMQIEIRVVIMERNMYRNKMI